MVSGKVNPKFICGAEGDRTPDLVNAIHALSQLSYSPIGRFKQAHKIRIAPFTGSKIRKTRIKSKKTNGLNRLRADSLNAITTLRILTYSLETWQEMKDPWQNSLVVALLAIGLQSFGGIGMAVFLIGFFFTMFYAYAVSSYMSGLLYLERAREGTTE